MPDLEKVIDGLEHEMMNRGKCGHYCREGQETVRCDYDKNGLCIQHWGKDALVLLKAHERELGYRVPKKVEHKATLYRNCTCPSCGNVVDAFEKWGDKRVHIMHNYCLYCGQKLDWSDEGR